MIYLCKSSKNPPFGSRDTVFQTGYTDDDATKFDSLCTHVTLKIRPRSPKSKKFFSLGTLIYLCKSGKNQPIDDHWLKRYSVPTGYADADMTFTENNILHHARALPPPPWISPSHSVWRHSSALRAASYMSEVSLFPLNRLKKIVYSFLCLICSVFPMDHYI